VSLVTHSPTAMADSVAEVTHDVHSILSSPDRDFLLRNTGDQVLPFHRNSVSSLLFFVEFYEIIKRLM